MMRQGGFAGNYEEARTRFVEAATRAGASLERHILPGLKGPGGEELSIDIAHLGPADADVVVLSLSGTHGVEGFCGSAAQQDWLEGEGAAAVPERVAAILVHAVNPFGFAHMVRGNENNVDLNRNFIDFSAPLPQNPLYEQLHVRLPDRIGFDEPLVAEWAQVYETFWREHGDWIASDAASRGQYDFPDGIQFGGREPQWSHRILLGRLIDLCAQARHLLYIDWHSLLRLGDGNTVFLCFNQTDDPLYGRVANMWGAEAIDRERVNRSWGEGWARSQRRPSRHGLLMWGLQHALAPQADVAGAVVEFCADPDRLHAGLAAGIRIGLYERWLLATRAYDSPDGQRLVALLREATSPTRPAFEAGVLQSSRRIYSQAFREARDLARANLPAAPGKLVRYSDFI